jgi:Arc/MetJ-type ribon-helix-helix transcriptional regulator
MCYVAVMATTTVRLDPDEEATLDELAELHGGRSNALRAGLRLLAAETRRRAALAELLEVWEHDAGPVDDDAVAAMADRYRLAP